MQLRIVPTLMAIATLFSALVAAAPAKSNEDFLNTNLNPNMNIDKLGKGKVFKGTATWYKPKTEGGDRGACDGVKIDDDSEIVALNAEQYGKMSKNSEHCFSKVKITGSEGSAIATIVDACPGCKYGDLDLTPVLFKQVCGNMKKGVDEIEWQFI
ncbi:unnamed protein product [Mucor hiemalis]